MDDIDKHVGGIELYKRFSKENGYEKPFGRPASIYGFDDDDDNDGKNTSFIVSLVTLGVIIGFFLSIISCAHFFVSAWRTRRRKNRRLAPGSDGIFKDKNPTTKDDGFSVNYINNQEERVAVFEKSAISDDSDDDVVSSNHIPKQEIKPSDVNVDEIDDGLDDVDLNDDDSAVIQTEPIYTSPIQQEYLGF